MCESVGAAECGGYAGEFFSVFLCVVSPNGIGARRERRATTHTVALGLSLSLSLSGLPGAGRRGTRVYLLNDD